MMNTPHGAGEPRPDQSATTDSYWNGRRVLVTGGSGFLGRHLMERLKAVGADHIARPRSREYDLTEQAEVRRLLQDTRPDVVLNLAAEVGGIGANRANPGRFFYANAAMGIHLIEESRRHGVEKFVQVGTICAYPKFTPVPFREEELWSGYPEETNAPYGIAKKVLLVQLQAYREQYGFNGIYLLPVNLYGPGDNFDPDSSHVIPALIRKMVLARDEARPEVELWGTGTASREFLYVTDCARAIVLAAERYDGPEPVNLGTGREIRIGELASLIARLVGYEGRLVYDPSKPDGQPRRCLDTGRALGYFGFRAETEFVAGLSRTIEWFRASQAERSGPPAVNAA